MDKEEQKPVDKPIEEKPNTEIPPPIFGEIEKSVDGDKSQTKTED